MRPPKYSLNSVWHKFELFGVVQRRASSWQNVFKYENLRSFVFTERRPIKIYIVANGPIVFSGPPAIHCGYYSRASQTARLFENGPRAARGQTSGPSQKRTNFQGLLQIPQISDAIP